MAMVQCRYCGAAFVTSDEDFCPSCQRFIGENPYRSPVEITGTA